MKHRLYFKIYLAVLASIVIFALATALLWRTLDDREERAGRRFDTVMHVLQNALADVEATPAAQQAALSRLTQQIPMAVYIYAADGSVLAKTGMQFMPPRPERSPLRGVPLGEKPERPMIEAPLTGGRVVMIVPPVRVQRTDEPSMAWSFIMGLVILLGAVAVTALPLTRRLTRRLERLNTGVLAWGQGRLSTRVGVEGRDEVAMLAQSFNQAAERIEQLVRTQKMLLANASHELRTPLTRIRLNVEMLKTAPEDVRQNTRKAAIEQDINELDEMIEDILLASRLEAEDAQDVDAGHLPNEEVDVLALVAEELAHYPEVALEGVSALVWLNPKLMRRLVRNLIENALKYGAPPIQVRIERTQDTSGLHVQLHFIDHGQGVALSDPNQLFEPFVRAHPSQQGAGLGLALVKKIAERLGGRATILSRSHQAMHVVITLPVLK